VRALRATRIAIEAETLRLQLLGRRTATRVALGAAALTFLLGALGLAHVAAWFCLRERYGWLADSTALLLAGIDVVIAGLCGLIALSRGPGRAEAEAALVRHQAWVAMVEGMVFPALALRVLRLLRPRPRPRGR
jgi:hypothetical protein